jgi:xylan 1,4-beta-xylosidase
MSTNPILPGFHPDPSILRVGEDYYIATSTFEWFPGVQIHHSRDLVSWRPLGGVLTRPSQLEMRGIPNSGGVWAPCLTWHDGTFYLIYSIMRTWAKTAFKDVHNYLVTAPNINGPWSEPVYLNSSGFDPSLFHDRDGRKWLTNLQWDFRDGRQRFAGIVIQEYDPVQRKLVGERRTIMQKKRLIEGPHLYRIGEYYYLMLAEGGTSWAHACTLARSKDLFGPYEPDPIGDFLTTGHAPEHPLQKCGHGSLVETPGGDWYVAFLCSRPVGPNRRCILGRETGLARCQWTDDGWLRLTNGDPAPPVAVDGLADDAHSPARGDIDIRFAPGQPDPRLQSLRVPMDDGWFDLKTRPGCLTLRGRESPQSVFEQSLVGVRLTHLHTRAETRVAFEPSHFSQLAGLFAWYDTRTWYFLHVTHTESAGKALRLSWSDDGVCGEQADFTVPLPAGVPVDLAFELRGETLQFFWRTGESAWQAAGPALDATKISDDYGTGLHFTGAFAAVGAYDLNAGAASAQFASLTVSRQDGGFA